MKNKTSKIARNSALVIAVVSYCLLLNSCGNEIPIIDGKNHFIVTEIKEYSETQSIYYGKIVYSTNKEDGSRVLFGSWYPAIIMKKKLYNIGDTIKSFK